MGSAAERFRGLERNVHRSRGAWGAGPTSLAKPPPLLCVF